VKYGLVRWVGKIPDRAQIDKEECEGEHALQDVKILQSRNNLDPVSKVEKVDV
jgi:hypothetical protein